MRRLFPFAFLLLGIPAFAQYPNVTIRQIQEVPVDSLLIADTLSSNQNARWTLQSSPMFTDTVTVTAVCVVPAKTITFTNRGWTMLLADTGASPYPWGGVLVRVRGGSDTTQATLDGFLNVERGDVIKMTGWVDEFPAGTMNSATQFVPYPGIAIEIIGSAPVPGIMNKTLADFGTGIFPNNHIQYSTGEPFEGIPVNLATPLTVDARVNTGRGTFSMVDGSGNQMTDYDASKYFTLGGTSLDHPGPDSIWTLVYPNAGTLVSTMRGFMTTVSGGEAPRGYRVSPLYYGDVGLGYALPSITTHRRNPVVVPPDSAARISVRVTRQDGGFSIGSVELNYSLNNGAFVPVTMSYQSTDSTYNGQVPQQAADTFVKYFVKATDSLGNSVILANSAIGGFSSDTSKGFFFYTVLNRPLTIQDVQTTPFANGRSPYLGGVVTLRGIVTADTQHINAAPLNTGGTNAWYFQSGNQPWSGLWILSAESTMAAVRNGDSITITGSVAEQFDVTALQNISYPITVNSTGNPAPAPVDQSTGTFGPAIGNGTPAAERYEGMLVRFTNVRVSNLNPVFADPTEFEVDDGSGPIIVRRDGTNNFSNVEADTITGRTILHLNDRISTLTGIIYYSFNRYKIVPRANDDYGTVTDVTIDRGDEIPDVYALNQNYPNPFNPSTTISFQIPKAGFVTLKVYNLLGQEVRTLLSGEQTAGDYTVRFDASSLSSGVYFYRLTAGDFSMVKRMLLLK